jgi:type IV pilus assembly protein PilB
MEKTKSIGPVFDMEHPTSQNSNQSTPPGKPGAQQPPIESIPVPNNPLPRQPDATTEEIMLQMSRHIEEAGMERIRLGLYSYTQEGIQEIQRVIDMTGIAGLLEVAQCDLARHEQLDCDIAMVICTPYDDLDRYFSDITSMQIVRHIPIVIAVVTQQAREMMASRAEELSVHEIIHLPIDPPRFIKRVMTHVVSIKLRGNRKPGTGEFSGKSRQLGEILVEHGLITPMQLKKALDYQSGTGMRLGDALVALGYIDEEQKYQFLASQLGVALATPKQYASADIETVALIPEHVAKRNSCIALEKDGDELVVAMLDVMNLQLLDNLRDLAEMTVKPVLGTPEDIQTSIERYYRDISSQKDASDLVADLGDDMEFVQEEESEEELNLEEATRAGAELGIVRLVNMLISNAVKDRASDIHIEPQDKELIVRFRVDGDLRRVMTPPRQSHQAIITRIKILSNLDIAERRLPQDGRMVVKMGLREVDVRVSILPSVFGEKAVLRILDKSAFEKSITNLGFDSSDEETFKNQIGKPYGMIIVTGPTGSGKSTTLYTAIQAIKSVTKNIITVEDPVEFHMNGVTQVNVNTKIGMTFGAALRSILRQDPDIVLIGEIRDDETADIAIKMALTGHLVFSTLHTNDACSSIARFVDIGIPPLLLGSALNLVIAQRLVRRICDKCKVEYTPEQEMLELLNLPDAEKKTFYKGEGCVNCNGTGYRGRVGIFEMLDVSREIRKLILRNAPTMEIQDLAEKEGMRTLRKASIEKVMTGETTIEQALAVTTEI